MQPTVLRIACNAAIVVFAVLFLDGCVIAHRGCLPSGTIIPRSDRLLINLSDLTSPGLGRNITASTREDRITATITPLTPGGGNFEVRLVAGPDVEWWKQVEVVRGHLVAGRGCFFDQEGTRVGVAETENQRRTASTLVLNSLAAETTLVLWKKKAAGFNTPMYLLRGNLASLVDQRLTINWEID